MCQWCERLILKPNRWKRHLDEWGWGYVKRHPTLWLGRDLPKLTYIKRSTEKPSRFNSK